MKRFIRKTFLLFGLPFVILVVLCEISLRHIPNDYSYKNDWLTKNAKTVKILNLGSSHALDGINPSLLSERAFNAAHISQTLDYDYFIFNKFKDDLDSLRVLIVSMSYFSIANLGMENGPQSSQVKKYVLYYGCDYHRFEPKYNLETYRNLHLHDAFLGLFGLIDKITCDEFGFAPIALESRDKHWQYSGKRSAKSHTYVFDSTKVETNKHYVLDMVQYCASNNIEVILLTTPTYYTYRYFLDTVQWNFMYDFCRTTAMENDNVVYLNLIYDNRFCDDDFYDADHLNELGARKLTAILQHTIDSVCHF